MSDGSRRKREVTVADVAREAGVGKATAARALGNYGAVSESVRDRVLAAAERLDYRPNELARSMNTGKSKTIGVIVGDIENGYFGLATRGISDAVTGAGYDVVLINTSEDVQAEEDAVRVLLDKRVDGMIVAPASLFETQHLRDVHASGRPLVLLDRRIDDLPVPSVGVAIAAAAEQAAAALVAAGHRRIAFVTALAHPGEWTPGEPLRVSSVTERLAGIAAALISAGIAPDRELIAFGANGLDATGAILDDLLALAEPPTAILASDSLIALDLLRAGRARGLRIPEDLSFVMFDDFPWAELIDPPLSVVAQPIYEVGLAAGRMLLRLLSGQQETGAEVLDASFVARESVGPVRAQGGAT
ncbi:LacI family DNA-binding transcriptional regulator [Rathayibacter sp. VKM Ac-2927]|uniref:LacI family DNA-binding transcriptional regulator n=1 Tax=Rathayibacter sp. VKM Ac-2927 TaxID=2929478 RepID=UPI001FB235C0|nr:LacI family DNA-binding transcriptional regulator [Rathayibacter sp. VKM Ac-2927]MCJ1687000.1 LacI family transcriptional regulator [Rathayibacter sp. VKM Ac-2927]